MGRKKFEENSKNFRQLGKNLEKILELFYRLEKNLKNSRNILELEKLLLKNF